MTGFQCKMLCRCKTSEFCSKPKSLPRLKTQHPACFTSWWQSVKTLVQVEAVHLGENSTTKWQHYLKHFIRTLCVAAEGCKVSVSRRKSKNIFTGWQDYLFKIHFKPKTVDKVCEGTAQNRWKLQLIVCEQKRKVKVTFSLPECSSLEHISLFYASHGTIEPPTNQYLLCDSLPLCSHGLPGERSGEASIFMSRLDGFIVAPWHELDNWLAGPFLSPKPSCSFRNPPTKREHLLSMRGHAPRQTATPTFFHKCVNLLLAQIHHNEWAIQSYGRPPGAGCSLLIFKSVSLYFF